MRIVAVGAGDAAAALTETFAIAEGGDLIRDEEIIGKGIFHDTEARVALGTGLHLIFHWESSRVENAFVRGAF
jgi:hypothetical protein